RLLRAGRLRRYRFRRFPRLRCPLFALLPLRRLELFQLFPLFRELLLFLGKLLPFFFLGRLQTSFSASRNNLGFAVRTDDETDYLRSFAALRTRLRDERHRTFFGIVLVPEWLAWHNRYIRVIAC